MDETLQEITIGSGDMAAIALVMYQGWQKSQLPPLVICTSFEDWLTAIVRANGTSLTKPQETNNV